MTILRLALLPVILLATSADALHDPDLNALEFKCQARLSKAAAKFFGAKQKCLAKCITGARKFPPTNPESDCFPPYGGATLSCIADPLKGAEAKAVAAIGKACLEIPGKTECPECYAARSGAADCSAHGYGVVVGGLSDPPFPSLETYVDSLNFLFCNDGPNTPAEDKCQTSLTKAMLGKFVGCELKCYDKCRAAMHKGLVPVGSCNAPNPSDPATATCLSGAFKGCQWKAVAAADKACFSPPADAPECYGLGAATIVALMDSYIQAQVPTIYCNDSTTTTTSSTTTSTLPCTGTLVGGFCWYGGSDGDSCTTTCANAGRTYDPATDTYAGSNGTDANCTAVLSALGFAPFAGTSGTGGLGCCDIGAAFGIRDTDPTTASASSSGFRRACACQ